MPNAPLQFSVVAELGGNIDTLNELMTTGPGMEHWVPICRSVKFVHPHGVLAVGSVRHVTLKIGVKADEHIVFLEAPYKLNYTIGKMGGVVFRNWLLDYEGVTVLEPVGENRHRLTWSVHYRLAPSLRLVSPLVRFALHALIATMVSNICRVTDGHRVT